MIIRSLFVGALLILPTFSARAVEDHELYNIVREARGRDLPEFPSEPERVEKLLYLTSPLSDGREEIYERDVEAIVQALLNPDKGNFSIEDLRIIWRSILEAERGPLSSLVEDKLREKWGFDAKVTQVLTAMNRHFHVPSGFG